MSLRSQLALLLLVALCSVAALARGDSADELKAKLSSAKVSDQPKLCLQIARLQMDAMEKAYQASHIPQAQALLQEVVHYTQQAGDAARKAHKHIKKTEIEVRKMSRRLQDLRPTLDVDNRQPVEDAVKRLEHIRTQLLMQMFSEH